MSNDDLRGLESPDRSHASTPTVRVRTDGGTTDAPVRERLESISELARSVLAAIQSADEATKLEDVDDKTRRDAKRRLREIDAETRRVGFALFGPSIPDRSTDGDAPAVVRGDPFATSYLGPEPTAFECARTDDSERADEGSEPDECTASEFALEGSEPDESDSGEPERRGDRDGE